MEIHCKVKRIKSAADKDFLEALKIYQKQVNACIKTDENQILQYVSKNSNTVNREMAFYALICNNKVIGYVEIGILLKTKIFFIDYFVLDNEYQNNAYFYVCYNLVIEDLLSIKKYSNFKYIIVENYIGSNENINEVFSKKCLSLENYKILDIDYKQPGLYSECEDSIVGCQLLIKETSRIGDLTSMSKTLVLQIIYDIFYNHYCEWFLNFFNNQEYESYYQTVTTLYKKLETSIKEKVKIKNYTYVNCKYFNSKCDFSQNSSFKLPKQFKPLIFTLILLAVFILSVGLAVGLTYLLKYLNVQDEIISTVTSISAVLLVSAGTVLGVKSSKK